MCVYTSNISLKNVLPAPAMCEAQVISVKIVPQIESVKQPNVRGINSAMAREIYRCVHGVQME